MSEPNAKRLKVAFPLRSFQLIPSEVLVESFLPCFTATELILVWSLINRRFHTLATNPLLFKTIAYRRCGAPCGFSSVGSDCLDNLPFVVAHMMRTVVLPKPEDLEENVNDVYSLEEPLPSSIWAEFVKKTAGLDLEEQSPRAIRSYRPRVLENALCFRSRFLSCEFEPEIKCSKLGGFPFLKPDEPYPTCTFKEYPSSTTEPPCGLPMELFLQFNSSDLPAGVDPEDYFGSDSLIQLFGCPHHVHCDPFEATTKLARIVPNISAQEAQVRIKLPSGTDIPPPENRIEGWSLPFACFPSGHDEQDVVTEGEAARAPPTSDFPNISDSESWRILKTGWSDKLFGGQ